MLLFKRSLSAVLVLHYVGETEDPAMEEFYVEDKEEGELNKRKKKGERRE